MSEQSASQDRPSIQTLVNQIKQGDAAARVQAVKQAVLVGVPAIEPLVTALGGDDPAAAKAAGEAIRRIAHHAARPGARGEAKTASLALVRFVGSDQPRRVRTECLSLLGYIGGAESVPAIAKQLEDRDVREEARMALERIPSPESVRALTAALKTVPAEYRPNIEQSLRHKSRK